MTRSQAHCLLDRAVAGERLTEHEITQALIETGDITLDDETPDKNDPFCHRWLDSWEWEGQDTRLTPRSWLWPLICISPLRLNPPNKFIKGRPNE